MREKPSHFSIEFGDCGIGFLSFFDRQDIAIKSDLDLDK
jgi:hypothetical protein